MAGAGQVWTPLDAERFGRWAYAAAIPACAGDRRELTAAARVRLPRRFFGDADATPKSKDGWSGGGGVAVNYNDTPDVVTTVKKVLGVIVNSNMELDWRPPQKPPVESSFGPGGSDISSHARLRCVSCVFVRTY